MRRILSEAATLALISEKTLLDLEIEFEVVDCQNAFEFRAPPALEPVEALITPDRYTGKCKKLRREARGW